MSYKVMIVDDEPIIRFGLASCINWEEEGLSLAGEAANGEAALSLIREQAIDILVTDIRMPLMDGLELTRQVKALLPNVKVILISSYSDFEFAREAVKLGVVVDYLLKPTMEPDDLLHILRICKQRLDNDQIALKKVEFFDHEEQRQQVSKFEAGLKMYLGGNDRELPWKPDWLTNPLVVAVWRQDKWLAPNADLTKILPLETVKDKLNNWCPQGISLVWGENEMITLMSDIHSTAVADIHSYHQQLAVDEEMTRFTVGISPSIHSFKSVRDALNWALLALELSFFEGKGKCYTGRISASHHTQQQNDNKGELEQEKKGLREAFSKGIASADKELRMASLERYILMWKSRSVGREAIITEARSLIMIMGSQHFGHRTEVAMQSTMNKLERIETVPTLAALVTFLRSELEQLWEPYPLSIATEDVGGAHIIQMALSYIQENYRREISLQEVADYVHMSKNYFSEQFKKRLRLNFIDFVICLRIHYAKHLLGTTSLKIGDVGLQSGFNSPKHFLKIFKRMVGDTPGDYRHKQARKQVLEGTMGDGV